MSEHTAEYALVGDIVRKLYSAFPNIVPMYIWLSREGSSMGQGAFFGKEVRLVSIFPRRPKVAFPGDTEILVKFNSSILRHAHLARTYGIPVLAGLPLVSDLSKYRIDSSCAWFVVNGTKTGQTDLEVLLSKQGEILDHVGPLKTIRGPVGDKEIIQNVESTAETGEWDSWLYVIREIGMKVRPEERRYFWFLPAYKPFYLVID